MKELRIMIILILVALALLTYKVYKLDKYADADLKVSQVVVEVLEILMYKTRNLQ